MNSDELGPVSTVLFVNQFWVTVSCATHMMMLVCLCWMVNVGVCCHGYLTGRDEPRAWLEVLTGGDIHLGALGFWCYSLQGVNAHDIVYFKCSL